jgi:hypothetical protein
MEYAMDQRQSPPQAGGSAEPWPLWNVGLAAVRETGDGVPGGRPTSLLAECECPEDCHRDHDND